MATSTLTIAENPMSKHSGPVASHLQSLLTDLIALQLQLKQARWNVFGPSFRSIHLELDEVHGTVSKSVDEIAERMLALDTPADGRPETVNRNSRIEPMPAGRIQDVEVVERTLSSLRHFIADARESQRSMADPDPVTEDLVIGIIGALEEHAWMLESRIRTPENH